MLLRWKTATVDLDSRRVLAPKAADLTTTEHRLLSYLAERLGQPISIEQLEREVWQLKPGTRSKTAPVTLRRLRRDLGCLERIEDGRWRMQRTRGPSLHHDVPEIPRDSMLQSIRHRFDTGWRHVSLVGHVGTGRRTIAAQFAETMESVVWIDSVVAGEPLPTHGLLVLDRIPVTTFVLPDSLLVLSIGGSPSPGAANLDVPPLEVTQCADLLPPEQAAPSRALRWPGVLEQAQDGRTWSRVARDWLEEKLGGQLEILAATAVRKPHTRRIDLEQLFSTERVETLVRDGWLIAKGESLRVAPVVGGALNESRDLAPALRAWQQFHVDQLDACFNRFIRSPADAADEIEDSFASWVAAIQHVEFDFAVEAARKMSWMRSGSPLLLEAIDVLLDQQPQDARARILHARVHSTRLPPFDCDWMPAWQALWANVSRIVQFERPLCALPLVDSTWDSFDQSIVSALALFDVPDGDDPLEAFHDIAASVRPFPHVLTLASHIAAVRLGKDGRTLDAVDVLRASIRVSRRHDLHQQLCFDLDAQATLLFDIAPSTALDLWTEVIKRATEMGDQRNIDNARACVAVCHLAAGQAEQASTQLASLLKFDTRLTRLERVGVYALHAVTLEELGETARARQTLALLNRHKESDDNCQDIVRRTHAYFERRPPLPESDRQTLASRIVGLVHRRRDARPGLKSSESD